MPSLARLIGTVLLSLAALGLLLLVLTLAANTNDEPLSDAARTALAYTPPTEADLTDNGHLILLGFDAPQGTDAAALGRQRLAREAERYAWLMTHERIGDEGPPPLRPIDNAEKDTIVPSPLRCDNATQDCMAHVLAHRADWQALIARQAWRLSRLKALAEAPHYSEHTPAYAENQTPPYAHLTRTSELALARASLALADGQINAALTHWDDHLRLLQRLAAHSQSLIGSMVPLNTMVRQMRWMSDALYHHPTLAQTPEMAERLASTLARVQVPLTQAIRGEQQAIAHILHGVGLALAGVTAKAPQPTLAQRAFLALLHLAYQPQRTLNASVQRFERYAPVMDAPADQLSEAVALAQAHIARDDRARRQWLGLRNALGEHLLAQSTLSYDAHAERVHDAGGYRRLVLLQIAALQAGVRPADMPSWLAASPAALRDPYTGQPMGWDSERGELLFHGRQPQSQNPGGASTYRVRLFTTSVR